MLAKKRPVIEKAIKKFGKEVEVKRAKENEFKEVEREVVVTHIKAFYYKGSSMLSIELNTQGEIKSNREERLMVAASDAATKLKEGDVIKMNGNKYEFADITVAFDLYYDIILRRAS